MLRLLHFLNREKMDKHKIKRAVSLSIPLKINTRNIARQESCLQSFTRGRRLQM